MYGANIAGNTKHWRNSATFGRQQSRIANPNSTSLAEMGSPWVSSRGMESEKKNVSSAGTFQNASGAK